MNTKHTLGLASLALGVVLLGLGFNASEQPLDQIHNTLTGRFTDTTMWYIIGGLSALLFGGFTVFLRK